MDASGSANANVASGYHGVRPLFLHRYIMILYLESRHLKVSDYNTTTYRVSGVYIQYVTMKGIL